MIFCLLEKWLEIMRHQAVEQAVWEQAVVTTGEFAFILAREFVGVLSPALLEPLDTDPRAITGRDLVALPGPRAVPDFVKMANREIWRAEQDQRPFGEAASIGTTAAWVSSETKALSSSTINAGAE